jgi:hypothetical protein
MQQCETTDAGYHTPKKAENKGKIPEKIAYFRHYLQANIPSHQGTYAGIIPAQRLFTHATAPEI